MKKIKVLFFLFFLLFAACVHTTPNDLKINNDLGKRFTSFVWEVEKAKDRSYLFGSIHAGVDAQTELPPEVWKLFNESSCYVMESDPSSVNAAELFAMSRLSSVRSLKSDLSENAWNALQERLKSVLPEQVLMTSQPWFAAMLFLQSVAPDGTSMDRVFLEKARKQGKKIFFLEDWREALSAFAASIDQHDLEELVTNQDELKQQTLNLIAAYRSGEVKKLELVIQDVSKNKIHAEEKLHKMLAGRNRRWIPRIEKIMKTNSCFIAVGAAHLIGKESVLALLEQKGANFRRF